MPKGFALYILSLMGDVPPFVLTFLLPGEAICYCVRVLPLALLAVIETAVCECRLITVEYK